MGDLKKSSAVIQLIHFTRLTKENVRPMSLLYYCNMHYLITLKYAVMVKIIFSFNYIQVLCIRTSTDDIFVKDIL